MLNLVFKSILIILSASHPGPESGDAPIIVRQGDLILFGATVDNKWSVESFQKGLGTQPRKEGSYDVYDSTGVFTLNSSPNSNKVVEFHVRFRKSFLQTDWEWEPKKYYLTSVMIENFIVTQSTTLSQLKAALPAYNFHHAYGNYHEGVLKDVYVLAYYDDAKTNLYWLAIGRKSD